MMILANFLPNFVTGEKFVYFPINILTSNVLSVVRCLFLGLIFYLNFFFVANGMEIRKFNESFNSRITVELSGTVTDGDEDKLNAFIASDPDQERIVHIYLNITGGNPLEGIKIGRYLRKHGFRTFIGRDAKCISACFFIFLGGYDNEAKRIFRVKEVRSTLEVHRTVLSIGDGPYSLDELNNVIDSHQILLLKIVEYLLDCEVDFKILISMLETPANKTYKILNSEAWKNKIKVENCDRDLVPYIECTYVPLNGQ